MHKIYMWKNHKTLMNEIKEINGEILIYGYSCLWIS